MTSEVFTEMFSNHDEAIDINTLRGDVPRSGAAALDTLAEHEDEHGRRKTIICENRLDSASRLATIIIILDEIKCISRGKTHVVYDELFL